MRCAYLTFQPAENDQNVWSGSNFHIRQALGLAGFEVEHLGSLAVKCPMVVRAKIWYYRQIKRGFDHQRNRTYLKKSVKETTRRIQENGAFDILLAPSSYPMAGLEVKTPKFVWLDSTFAGLIDYYPGFDNLSRETLKEGQAVEAEALRECAGVFFASEWAAEGAIRSYQLDERRVHVIPFGANMEPPYDDAAEARLAIQKRGATPYEFLFIGVDWERKGGAFAVEVVQKLNALGVPVRLTIVGCQPTLPADAASSIRVIGFLDKTKPEQMSRLRELLAQSHFLILPTRAEAYGLVFAEAASFAVPSLAIYTGGVPTLVQNARTGILFKLEDGPSEWAKKISELLKDSDRYPQMAVAAYDHYRDTLNWQAAAKRLKEIITANVS